MTIFEWCDKNPDTELNFYWNYASDEFTIRSREFVLPYRVCYEFYDLNDLNVGVIKEQIIRNKNVSVYIRTNDRYSIYGIYELTFQCASYKYKRVINRYEIETLNPEVLDSLINQIFDDAMKELSDAFLGRDK